VALAEAEKKRRRQKSLTQRENAARPAKGGPTRTLLEMQARWRQGGDPAGLDTAGLDTAGQKTTPSDHGGVETSASSEGELPAPLWVDPSGGGLTIPSRYLDRGLLRRAGQPAAPPEYEAKLRAARALARARAEQRAAALEEARRLKAKAGGGLGGPGVFSSGSLWNVDAAW